MAIDSILDQIRRDEGERASVYQDQLGYWTIGNGICVDARRGCALRPEEIDYLTNNRLSLARRALLYSFPWLSILDVIRFAALQNMVYQMGIEGVSRFKTMLTCLQAEDWAGAKAAALDSEWEKQTPARAARIAEQLLTGEWQ